MNSTASVASHLVAVMFFIQGSEVQLQWVNGAWPRLIGQAAFGTSMVGELELQESDQDREVISVSWNKTTCGLHSQRGSSKSTNVIGRSSELSELLICKRCVGPSVPQSTCNIRQKIIGLQLNPRARDYTQVISRNAW